MLFANLGWWIQHALLWWLGLLALFVMWRLFRDPRIINGFLVSSQDEAGRRGAAQMDRTQLLIAFAFALGGYILEVSRAIGQADQALTAMPEVPETLLAILAGSQAIYVSGKVSRKVSG